MCQISPPPRKRGLTDVELVTLVCNIVYVPMVALYHMYRLLTKKKKTKKCTGYVIRRYLKA